MGAGATHPEVEGLGTRAAGETGPRRNPWQAKVPWPRELSRSSPEGKGKPIFFSASVVVCFVIQWIK